MFVRTWICYRSLYFLYGCIGSSTEGPCRTCNDLGLYKKENFQNSNLVSFCALRGEGCLREIRTVTRTSPTDLEQLRFFGNLNALVCRSMKPRCYWSEEAKTFFFPHLERSPLGEVFENFLGMRRYHRSTHPSGIPKAKCFLCLGYQSTWPFCLLLDA